MRSTLALFFSCAVCFGQLPVIPFVTQSSGGFNFNSVPGLFLEFFADNSTSLTNTVDGSDAPSWKNLVTLAGEPTSAVAYSAKSVPIYRATGGPAGLPALDFNRSSGSTVTMLSLAADFQTNQPVTVFVVCQNYVSGVNSTLQTIWDNVANLADRQFLHIKASGGGNIFAGITVPSLAYAYTNWVVHSVVISNAASYHRINGVNVCYGPASANTFGQILFGNDGSFVSQFTGRMAALLAYGGTLFTTNQLQSVENALISRYSLPTFDVVTNWAAMVINNGGGIPSSTSVTSMRTFWNGCLGIPLQVADFYTLNGGATDNLLTYQTPLICRTGNSLYANVNFVSGDLSANGLTGNGSNKRLDVGVNPNADFVSPTNCGFTLYAFASTSGSFSDFGKYVSSPNDGGFNFNLRFSGTTYFDIFCLDANRVSVTFPGNGYFSGNRTTSTSLIGYYASSSTAHKALGTNTVACGTSISANDSPLFAQDVNGVIGNYTPNTYSFFAIHRGFFTNESYGFFTNVQVLKTNLGGGHVFIDAPRAFHLASR